MDNLSQLRDLVHSGAGAHRLSGAHRRRRLPSVVVEEPSGAVEQQGRPQAQVCLDLNLLQARVLLAVVVEGSSERTSPQLDLGRLLVCV